MKSVNPIGKIEGVYSALNQYRNILSNFNNNSYNRLLEAKSQMLKTVTVNDIVGREMNLIRSFNNPILTYPETFSAVTKHWDAVSKLTQSIYTPEMEKLHKALMVNDYNGINTFVSSFSKAVNIEAQNMAFLKTTKLFENAMVTLPRGLSTAIKDLHVGTATRLLKMDKLAFDIPSKVFYLEDEPEERASVSETNIICSSLNVLPNLGEAELIKFLNWLSKFPNLALKNPTGEKILEVVLNWTSLIDFDNEMYYHARTVSEGDCPFTEAQMQKAPSGVTWHGRYNFIGESHYYFSNKPKGAAYEAFKHSKDSMVQIAKLKPKRSIRMVDLSKENLSQNKFLEFCRFSPNPGDYSNIKREYLLPCFVANCCKYAKIEGIKYYGSKEYANYVSWDDTYFDCIGFFIEKRGN